MEDYPFGVDVSEHQGCIDWSKVASLSVVFAFVRATVSWGFVDKLFRRNWAELKKVPLVRGAYHVVYPGEDPRRQVDHFLKVIQPEKTDLLALDCELDHGMAPDEIAKNILRQAQYIERETGRRPIIYTRASWVNQFLAGAGWLNLYDWWLASYSEPRVERMPPPVMPRGVRSWLVHQTTGSGQVLEGMPNAKALDRNRWNGDVASLWKYVGIEMPKLNGYLPQVIKEGPGK